MLVTDGRYDLVNKTNAPLSEVHVRQGDRTLEFLKLDVAGARLASNDKKFGYRIYRFDTPLAPGATTALTFKSRLWRRGFPRIRAGDRHHRERHLRQQYRVRAGDRNEPAGPAQDRAKRRRQHLPPELRLAKLEDMSATAANYIGSDWVTSDITADDRRRPDADRSGRRVSDVTQNGRRTAHFVSTAPILNFFSIQSADYQRRLDRPQRRPGCRFIYHPGHDWNVAKMLRAMGSGARLLPGALRPLSVPLCPDHRVPGLPELRSGLCRHHALFGNRSASTPRPTIPKKIDFTTYVVAHEMSHQYWAHQVIGAEMQGETLTSETLAQYSALMVMKHLYGPDQIRRFLKYELDNYLRGRQTEVVEEVPLERVENQQYIHYRKGALVMYLLQQRLGEDAVDRALARFDAKWRFKGPPYLRSLDLIAEFRKEAKTPEQQALITDLFEKITLYDLKVTDASTKKDATGWTTTLTVKADKYYANGKGVETKARLAEPIEIGLFTARPGLGDFSSRNVVMMERRPIRERHAADHHPQRGEADLRRRRPL